MINFLKIYFEFKDEFRGNITVVDHWFSFMFIS